MKITDIKIGHRFRKELGDLDALAASIRDRKGLFQPVVVTTDGQLVAGYRRLKACERLGWEDVPVRVVDPDDLVLAEHDENECREDFTPSERVAIAREVQRRIGDRRGQRTGTAATSGQLTGSSTAPEPVANGPQVDAGEKTRDRAAKAAGFTSTGDYRRAATVVDRGVPELVDAMDDGAVSPSAAAEVARLPEAEQKKVVAGGPEKVKAKAKEQREGRRQKKVVAGGPAKVKAAPVPSVLPRGVLCPVHEKTGKPAHACPGCKAAQQQANAAFALANKGMALGTPSLDLDPRAAERAEGVRLAAACDRHAAALRRDWAAFLRVPGAGDDARRVAELQGFEVHVSEVPNQAINGPVELIREYACPPLDRLVRFFAGLAADRRPAGDAG